MSNEKGMTKIREIVDDVKVCMFVTQQGAHMRSRPMHTSEICDEGNFWFFTDEYSGKVDEVEKDRDVNLAYSSPSSNTYLSICGKANLVTDQKKIDDLWNPMLKAWFPEGKDSGRIALLRIKPVSAEYWDASSSKLVELFKIGKAMATGETYSGGEHGVLSVS